MKSDALQELRRDFGAEGNTTRPTWDEHFALAAWLQAGLALWPSTMGVKSAQEGTKEHIKPGPSTR